MKKNIFIIVLFSVLSSLSVMAQDNVEGQYEAPKTLFPYPQAPDTISSFQERANYVVIRFWDRFDVSKPIQDEVAFDKAFQDYLNFFPHAHKTVVVSSIKGLMNRAQSNKGNFMLIGRVAEKNLYSPQAVFASDEAYLPFAEAVVKNASLKKEIRELYRKQIEKINQNMVGALCPELNVTGLDGKKGKLSELFGNELTILFFNDGECPDCSLDRIRLSTNVMINNLISEGKVKVVCISPKKYSKEWAEDAKTWADNWTIVASDDVANTFDLRISPCIYIINREKKIDEKNVTVNMLLR